MPVFTEVGVRPVSVGPRDLSSKKLLCAVDKFQLKGEAIFFETYGVRAENKAMMQAGGDDPIPEDGLPYVPHVACYAGHGQPPTPGGA